MVKVFTPNKDGKIEFTKDELEKLLNEVWYDGKSSGSYYWTSPDWYHSPIITNSVFQYWCRYYNCSRWRYCKHNRRYRSCGRLTAKKGGL